MAETLADTASKQPKESAWWYDQEKWMVDANQIAGEITSPMGVWFMMTHRQFTKDWEEKMFTAHHRDNKIIAPEPPSDVIAVKNWQNSRC